MHLRGEDTGSYSVRAVNRAGEAISTATLRVIGKVICFIFSLFNITKVDSIYK